MTAAPIQHFWLLPAESWLLKMPVITVVPGHFELASKEQLRRLRDYLAALRDQVGQLYRSGISLEQMEKSLKMQKYQNFRQYPQFEATFADNAAAYYHQLEKRNRR